MIPTSSSTAPGGTGAVSSSSRALRSQCDIRAELKELLKDPKLASAMRGRMQTRLFEDGNQEEWARAELLDLLGAKEDGPSKCFASFGGMDVTAEECLEHGWPSGCFTACTCASRCMVRLARRDNGAQIGAILQRLRSARKHDEAQPSSSERQAHAALEKSVWRSAGMSALSPLLQAVLQEEQAAAQAQAPAGESFDAVALKVNAELTELGCCRNGRVALLGLCRNWLSFKREVGGARSASSRQKERGSVEQALAADPCVNGCVSVLSIQNAEMFKDEFLRAPNQAEREVCVQPAERCLHPF